MNYLNQKKRYVIYNGIIEPSKVPPLWHAWLHYLSHEIPTKDLNKNKLFWQQGHLPNVSGTKRAHNSHISNITSAHSTIWTPKQ
jgi:NADH:ubiquinone oxidoreductase subunit